MRSMVEGRPPGTWAWGIGPSTTLRVVPLPTATPQGGLRTSPSARLRPSNFITGYDRSDAQLCASFTQRILRLQKRPMENRLELVP